jgi:5-methyltetrahydrofolate--homocysteine methyltransferase
MFTTEFTSTLRSTLLELDEAGVLDLIQKAIDDGAAPVAILEEGLTPAITEVGERFERGELFLPELLVSADIFTKAIDIVKPHLKRDDAQDKGTVVIGTAKGDIHEIGKNVVKLMLEVAGFEVIDLGIDVPEQAFLDKQQETGAEIIAASALLSSTMPRLKDLVEMVREACLPAAVIVGGAPVTEGLAKEYGADGYSPDAIGAVRLVEGLVAEARLRALRKECVQ